MESFRRVLLATTELRDRPSKPLRALHLCAKTIVFTLIMDTFFVDTRRNWCKLSSELRSVRSLRRFPSVSGEYAAAVSRASVAQHPYTRFLHRCQTNLHEKLNNTLRPRLKKLVFVNTFLISCETHDAETSRASSSDIYAGTLVWMLSDACTRNCSCVFSADWRKAS